MNAPTFNNPSLDNYNEEEGVQYNTPHRMYFGEHFAFAIIILCCLNQYILYAMYIDYI